MDNLGTEGKIHMEDLPETEVESLRGSVNNLEIGQFAIARFAARKLNQYTLKCGPEVRKEIVALFIGLMNIICDQDNMLKVLQAKNDTLEKLQGTPDYANVASTAQSPKVVKGTPHTLLISSVQEEASPEMTERYLRENL